MPVTAGLDQRLREGLVCGQVQVGEENLAGPEHGALDRLRLLHLDDEVGLGENFLRLLHELCARLLVIGVRIARVHAGAALDDDLMAAFHELIRRRGQQGDAMFLFLDFFGQANDHNGQVRYS